MILSRSIRLGLSLGAMLAGIVTSWGTSIQFDNGTSQVAIGSDYQGMTFSSNAIYQENFGINGTSPEFGIGNQDGRWQYDFTYANRIIITFDADQTSIGITAADVGFRGARMDAYDSAAGGSLVDFDQAIGVAEGDGDYFNLSVSATAIRRIELYQVTDDLIFVDGMIWDNLVILPGGNGLGNLTPDGGSLLPLLGSTLGLMALARARRR